MGVPFEPSGSDPTDYKYWGFLSYSHHDERWARWLHRSIERFPVPRALVGGRTSFGARPRRLAPIFRDRDELASSGDLSKEIQDALRQSRFLIVVCSPTAAVSRWVNEEIVAFKVLGRADRVLALIVDGEPHATERPEEGRLEAFPRALRFVVGASGELTSKPAEPLAADARHQGDGPSRALSKLLAGMLEVGFDDLRHREKRRRQRRMVAIGLATTAATVAIAAGWQNRQNAIGRQETINAAQRLAADSLQIAEPPGSDPSPRALLAVESLRRASTADGVSAAVASLAIVPRLLAELHAGGNPARLAFSADNDTLVSASDAQVRVWDLTIQRPVSKFVERGYVSTLALSPDGALVATATIDSTANVWDARSGRARFHVDHGDTVEAIAFDAIGHMVTESNGTVRVWDSQNGAPRDAASVTARRFLSGADGVSRESFRESPRWQLTMSGTTVSVVDRSTGREVGRLPSNGFAVGAVASPDGTRVATGDDEGVVRVWEPIATAGVTLQHDTPIGAAAVNSDCSLVVTSTGHGVRVWDVGTGRERRRLLGELAIGRLVISPDGSVIASARGGYDGQPDSVVIASVTSGETLRRIPVPAAVRELAFSADSKTLIMTTEHTFGTLRVSSGSAVRSFTEDDEIAFIAINRDGQTLALASGNRVSLWDVASGQRGVTLPFIGVVTQMAFSSDGTLATMSGSGVRLWNVSNRAERPLLHDDIVRGVAFDPRAQRLVTFTNTRARVWSMDGVMRADLPHNEMVVAAAVAGGDIVATLTKSAVHVWSTDTAHELATIPMNEELESLWLSPDGRVVSVGVGGRMVRILRWRSDDIMNELCRRLTRNMNEKDWTARFPGEVYRRSCAQLPPGTIR